MNGPTWGSVTLVTFRPMTDWRVTTEDLEGMSCASNVNVSVNRATTPLLIVELQVSIIYEVTLKMEKVHRWIVLYIYPL